MLLNWLLRALILALPFEYFFYGRDQTLYSSLKLQLGLFLAAWAGMMLWAVVRSGWRALSRPLRLFAPRFLLAVSCLACTQVLAAVLAPEYGANAARAAVKLCLGVLVMIAAADVLHPVPRRPARGQDAGRGLLVCLGIAGTSCALIGLADAAGLGWFNRVVEAFQPQRYFLGDHARLTSTMEYPTTAGSFLAATLFAALALAIGRPTAKGRFRRNLWFAAALVTGAALILTYSRGAIGAAIAALALCALAPGIRLAARERMIVLGVMATALLGLAAVVARSYEGPGEESAPRLARSALYGLKAAEELKFLLPDRTYEESIGLRNNSSGTWTAGAFGLAARWYDIGEARSSPLAEAAVFRRPVGPGEQTALTVAFQTPRREGDYLLIWFVVRLDDGVEAVERSYSPGVVCSVRAADSSNLKILGEKALGYMKSIREERRRLATNFVPARPVLWMAALQMLRANPLLGVGPDNFRLLKWKYMDMPEGDETILANSLLLEFLSGSGILGLAALLWFLWEILRRLRSKYLDGKSGAETALLFYSLAYFSGFLVHGLVDYFLKFTPTFLLFWITAGMAAGRDPAEEGNDAPGV